jgi:beta-galactosidase
MIMAVTIWLILAISAVSMAWSQKPSFNIDYNSDTFRMDGEPFRYVSGSLHYFRVPRDLWKDRMQKMRAGGFNAIQFVVEWNLHEPKPGQYDFEGILDINAFIQLAQDQGLYVLLRPGPYICAERNGGGLPYWLYAIDPDIRLRTSDPKYLKYVDKWWDVLLPKIKHQLYVNGGPIIMVQLENEYGSYGLQTKNCDTKYGIHLRDLIRKHLGTNVQLYTTDGDGDGYLRCGQVPGVYATVDFGPGANVTNAFAVQRRFEPHGPLVNSEFYPGWLDYWAHPHNVVGVNQSAVSLDQILATGANVNIYMAHGGTSFGFGNGANTPPLQVRDPFHRKKSPITISCQTSGPRPQIFGIHTLNCLRKAVGVKINFSRKMRSVTEQSASWYK